MTTWRLSDWDLRAAFNASGIWERGESGDLRVDVTDGIPDPAYNQPPGTVSRMYVWWEVVHGRIEIHADAHAFVLNGVIQNRKQRPDPKVVYIGGDTLKLCGRRPANGRWDAATQAVVPI